MQSSLRKSLTTFDGIALLIGITIGSGIYSTPYIIAGYYESFFGVLTTWLVVAGFVMIGGLIYAELGTRFPSTGGEYVYLNKRLVPTSGFFLDGRSCSSSGQAPEPAWQSWLPIM